MKNMNMKHVTLEACGVDEISKNYTIQHHEGNFSQRIVGTSIVWISYLTTRSQKNNFVQTDITLEKFFNVEMSKTWV